MNIKNMHDIKLRELQLEEGQRELTDRRSKINKKFQGYCILWNNKNSNGQYFTLKTDFGNLNNVNKVVIFINGHNVIIGQVKLSKDELGIQAEIEIDISTEKGLDYAENINNLFLNGAIQIKANPDIEKIQNHYGDMASENGHIKYWPIADIILILIPASPRLST